MRPNIGRSGRRAASLKAVIRSAVIE